MLQVDFLPDSKFNVLLKPIGLMMYIKLVGTSVQDTLKYDT